MKEMQNKSANEIGQLMKISDQLSTLNYDRYQSFSLDPECEDAKPAALMFDGDTYTDCKPKILDKGTGNSHKSISGYCPVFTACYDLSI